MNHRRSIMAVRRLWFLVCVGLFAVRGWFSRYDLGSIIVMSEENRRSERMQKRHAIIVLTLPYSNDMIVHRFFKCGSKNASLSSNNTNFELPRSPSLEGCSNFQVFENNGTVLNQVQCSSLSFQDLEKITKQYTNTSVVFLTIPANEWVENASAFWLKGDEGLSLSVKDLLEKYNNYTDRVRSLVTSYPQITYIERAWNDSAIRFELERQTGFPRTCWKTLATPTTTSTHSQSIKPPKTPTLKVPTPIFVLSLPKSGTTSIAKFFACGLNSAEHERVSHHWFRNETEHLFKLGVCMGQNLREGKRLLDQCGDPLVITDAGAMWNDEITRQPRCFYPSVHGLDHIFSEYPNATIMLMRRNATEWVHSAKNWSRLLIRWSKYCPGFPGHNATTRAPTSMATDTDWVRFYEQHTESIRSFVRDHPSLTYIEASLDSIDTGATLEEETGLPSSCWKMCLPNRRSCEEPSA